MDNSVFNTYALKQIDEQLNSLTDKRETNGSLTPKLVSLFY